MKLLEFNLILLLKNKMFRSKLSKKPQNDKQSIQEKVFEPITSIIKIKSKKKRKKKLIYKLMIRIASQNNSVKTTCITQARKSKHKKCKRTSSWVKKHTIQLSF